MRETILSDSPKQGMLRLCLFVLCLLGASSSLFAQPKPINLDSLENTLQDIEDEKERWLTYTTLFKNAAFAEPLRAYQYAEEALLLAQSQGDDSLLAHSYANLGTSKVRMDEYDDAIEFYSKAIPYTQEARDNNLMIGIRINMGTAYFQMKNRERGMAQLEDALGLIRDDTPGAYRIVIYNNLGATYEGDENFDGALEMYQEAAKLLQPNDVRRRALNLSNISQVYNALKKYEEAVQYAEEAVEIVSGTGFKEQLVTSYRNMADALGNLGRTAEASRAIDSMMFHAVNAGIPTTMQVALVGKSQHLEKVGRYKEALDTYQQYVQYKDSVSVANQEEKIAELQVKMDVQEKEAAATLATTEAEVERQKRLRQRNLLWLLGIGLGVLVIAATILVIGLVVRSRANSQLRERNEIIAQKNDLLQRQKSALEDLNREKDGLIGIVAHDLKSPLNKSLALMEMIETSGKLNPAQQRAADMIKKSNADGTLLIRDLLELNSIEMAEVDQELSPVEAREFLQEMAATFAAEADRKKIELEMMVPKDRLEFQTHRLSLGRILENLISNALKFSPAGTSIKVEALEKAGQLELAVRDQGPGISSEDQQKLFKKFQRLSAKPTGGESSTGLGLAITKSLVEKLGGFIRVESELGKGTSFVVSLPLA